VQKIVFATVILSLPIPGTRWLKSMQDSGASGSAAKTVQTSLNIESPATFFQEKSLGNRGSYDVAIITNPGDSYLFDTMKEYLFRSKLQTFQQFSDDRPLGSKDRFHLVVDVRQFPAIYVELNSLIPSLMFYFVKTPDFKEFAKNVYFKDRVDGRLKEYMEFKPRISSKINGSFEEEAKVLFTYNNIFIVIFSFTAFIWISTSLTRIRAEFARSQTRGLMRNVLAIYSAKRFLAEKIGGIFAATIAKILALNLILTIAGYASTSNFRFGVEILRDIQSFQAFLYVVAVSLLMSLSLSLAAAYEGLRSYEKKTGVPYVLFATVLTMAGLGSACLALLFKNTSAFPTIANSYIPFMSDYNAAIHAIVGESGLIFFAKSLLFHSLFSAAMFAGCLYRLARCHRGFQGGFAQFLKLGLRGLQSSLASRGPASSQGLVGKESVSTP
jgi:hypothetical protein